MLQNEKIPVLGSLDEKVVETKTCKHCGTSFDITDKDLLFYEKISPVFPENKESCHSELDSESLENKNFNSKKDPDSPVFGRTGGHGNLIKKLGNGKVKYLIPSPSFCPDCRQQKRLSFRNERNLYKRKCDFSGKEIISIYSPDKPYKVYDRDIWISDKWDACNYTKDFDFSRDFFEQLEELTKEVPKKSINLHLGIENSNYCNQCWYIKDSYLCFNTGYVENCLYTQESYFSKKVVDSLMLRNSEICYQSFNCDECFQTFFSQSCNKCSYTFFSYDCIGCNNIFMCSNLRNKNYYIKNKECSKEEYFKKMKNITFQKQSKLEELNLQYKNLLEKSIRKENNNIYTQNSKGDYLNEVKNSDYCFNMYKGEDCKYVYDLDSDGKTCHDINYFVESENCYECISVAGYNNVLCNMTIYGKYNYYCELCNSCEYCFGCVGLKNKKYCVFNKEYSCEDYEKLVPKIISHMQKTGEWGEFFPASISPFGYNETVAEEYYPINTPVLRDIPLNKGDSQSGVEAGGVNYIDKEGNAYNTIKEAGGRPVFKWSNYEAPFPKVAKIIPASKLPDNIKDIPDDILTRAIECEITKKPFKIIKEELDFYRKHNLPIPKRHPDERHKDRMKLRNPRKLYTRDCDKCGVGIQTTYAPERPEKVYCEKCYNREVY